MIKHEIPLQDRLSLAAEQLSLAYTLAGHEVRDRITELRKEIDALSAGAMTKVDDEERHDDGDKDIYLVEVRRVRVETATVPVRATTPEEAELRFEQFLEQEPDLDWQVEDVDDDPHQVEVEIVTVQRHTGDVHFDPDDVI